jgi:dTDP-4-amino-4,6-dideoxygalactose transaminase
VDQINLSAPDVGAVEERYLLEAVRSGWVAPVGPDLDAFEQEIAERVGTGYALALSSGVAALHLGLLGLNVGPGQLVIVPSLTFVATANAVIYTGADPVFVDCDPATGNIDVALLADLLSDLLDEGHRIGAVIPVDVLGSCADYASLLPLCAAFGIPVLEDAAEALGATYRGRPAGSFGKAAALSFNGNKIITTSGGGMLVSDDRELVARCRYLSTQARQPVSHYEHTDVGYNYRLSNLLAAVGRAQLSRLDTMMARRRYLRERYAKAFADIDGVCVLGDGDPGANAWLTAIVVDPDRAGWQSADLAAHLAAEHIETRPMWKPMHLQPVFARARAATSGASERLFQTALILPSGSALDEKQISRVFESVEMFLDRA